MFRGPNMNPRRRRAADRGGPAARDPLPAWRQSRATGTDANAMQLNRAGVATGLVSIPNRYMHSAVEMVSLDDIDRAADLLAAFVANLNGDEDFTP